MNLSFSLSFGDKRKKSTPVNRYEGAFPSTKRSNLPTTFQPAERDIRRHSRIKLAEKARYFVKNSPIVSGIVERMAALVIGTGIIPIAASSDPIWNDKAERVWIQWMRRADLTSRATYGQLQRVWYKEMLTVGESFRSLTYGLSGRPRIQTFDASQVTDFQQDDLDGITLDSIGRPAKYKIYYDFTNRKFQEFDAEFIVHDFMPIRSGQRRGVTIFAPAINTAHDIDDILTLEREAVKHLSGKRDVIKTKSGEIDPDQLRRERWKQSENDPDITSATSDATRENYYKTQIGSETLILKHDDEYDLVIPDRPSSTWQGFMEFLTYQICMPLGVAPSMLLQMKVGGADTRRDTDIAARVIETHQDAMIPGLQRDWEYVIGAEVEDGSLKGAPADWREVDWQCPRSITVDAGRRDTSDRRAVAMGLYPFQDFCGEAGIGNWRRQLRKNGAFAQEVKKVAVEFEVAESAVFNPSVENFDPAVQLTQEAATDAPQKIPEAQ